MYLSAGTSTANGASMRQSSVLEIASKRAVGRGTSLVSVHLHCWSDHSPTRLLSPFRVFDYIASVISVSPTCIAYLVASPTPISAILRITDDSLASARRTCRAVPETGLDEVKSDSICRPPQPAPAIDIAAMSHG